MAKHRDLITEVKQYKHAIIQLIKSQHAHALFGEADDDPRFASDTCPKCHQRVYVMSPTDGDNTSTRRLSVHRMPDGKTVCRGGGLASTIDVNDLLNMFLEDRAIERPASLLTWRSLWASFQAWSFEKKLLPLPDPETLQAAMSDKFERVDNPQGPAWAGLVLRMQQWLGDQNDASATQQRPKTPKPDKQQQLVFKG